MQRQILISVIIPFYNAQNFLAEAINSVQSQTYIHWELLLINDGSTDRSTDIAKEFAERDSRIKLLSLSRNAGAGVSRNLGTTKATGDYIAFLDADDRWIPKKLEIQLQFMLKHHCSVSYSSYALIDSIGKPLDKMVQALPKLDFQKLLKSNYIGNLTGMYKTAALGKLAISPMRKRQDWALWLDAVKRAGYAKGISLPLAEYRLGENSLSRNKFEMLGHNFAVFRKHLGYSYPKSLSLMCRFLWEHFMVKPRQVKDL